MAIPINNKIEPNRCWLTGEEIFEATAVYAQDHPLAGHVLKIGKALPGACRATLLLMDGSHTAVNVHVSVVDEVRGRLVELWRNVRARYLFQTLYRDLLYVKGDQSKYDQSMKNTLKRVDDNPPIDVLGIETWKEIVDRRAAVKP